MSLQPILFVVCGAVALGGMLAAITRRDALQSTILLAAACLGVAGLFVLLEALAIAVLQLLLAAGIVFLIRLAPQAVKEIARADPGLNRRWWQAASVAAALGAVLVWTVVAHTGASGLLSWSLILAALLFCAGLYAVLAQRDMLGLLMGIVIMLNGVTVNLAAFSGQVFAAAVYVVLVAEMVAGLACGVALWRSRGTAALDEADLLGE
jgi:NADH-quinone oxidoreductase subunit K